MNIWDDNLLSEKFDIVMKEGQLNMKAFESESTMQHTNLFKSASNDHTTQESRCWLSRRIYGNSIYNLDYICLGKS